MAPIQPISPTIQSTQTTTVNGITDKQVKFRRNDLEKSMEFVEPAGASRTELTYIASVRNNIMLDKVLSNQNIILENQNKIMQKLGIGENINIKA